MSEPKAGLSAVPFTAVTFNDDFWASRLETNQAVTLPHLFQQAETTGRVDNFIKAAKQMTGPHQGLHFNDSDIYKTIEAAAYSLQQHPDPVLEAQVDDLIAKVAAAQEPDGYLYTARTIDPTHPPSEYVGPTRWSNLGMSHELYNAGHMYEAA
jgi:DUF1680 family protein